MLNFGLTEMRLVAPRDGWPNPDAGPSASGADVVLEQAQVFDTVQEAIADCSTVYASTVRRRDLVMPVVTPEAMAEAIARSPERSAILFGPERSGLETEDVALAKRHRHRADQPRVRLAQPRPGGDPARLRMVEDVRARGAAVEGAGAARAARRARGPDRAARGSRSKPRAITTRPSARRRPRTRSGRSSPSPAGRRARSRPCAG